jgi:integrase/recombinase XerD
VTVEEVTRLIDGARTLTDRTMLMVLYSTGMRNAEMRSLQMQDIDSRSMLIHIQRGKGGRDRYVPLSPTLLETSRAYWRWMKPKTWLARHQDFASFQGVGRGTQVVASKFTALLRNPAHFVPQLIVRRL